MSNTIIQAWERFLIGCRWLQVPLIFGLVVALIIFEVAYFREVLSTIAQFPDIGRSKAILIVLDLIDMVLIANLVVMVMISGYEIFVGRFRVEPDASTPPWIGGSQAAGELEVKIATTILLISTIHLLHDFLDPPDAADQSELVVLVTLHVAFLLTAFAFVFIERLMPHSEKDGRSSKQEPEG